MATSSIDNHVVIRDIAAAKRLLAAFEEADKRGQTVKPFTAKERLEREKAVKEYQQWLRRQCRLKK